MGLRPHAASPIAAAGRAQLPMPMQRAGMALFQRIIDRVALGLER
jgi:hypothetical protein